MTVYEACHANDWWTRPPADFIDQWIRRGVAMRKYSVVHGHKNKNNYEPTEEMAKRVQSLGALSEGAVAYGLGYPIELLSEVYNVPDLPNDIQVRLIGVDHYGLRVYPQHDGKGDKLHWKIVGVVIERGQERKPPWRIPGWIYARDAQREEWSMDPHGRNAHMWAVPQKFLRDPRELFYRGKAIHRPVRSMRQEPRVFPACDV